MRKPQVLAAYGKLPLSFEANQGQTDERVKFLSRGKGYTLFLTPTEAVLALRKGSAEPEAQVPRLVNDPAGTGPRLAGAGPRRAGASVSPVGAGADLLRSADSADRPPSSVVRMKLLGANPEAQVMGIEELPGKSNYFIGNDPEKWRTNVPHYTKVKYEQVYPGIDLVYYGTDQRQLEYDFVVAPGADPKAIQLTVEGAEEIRVDGDGDLVVETEGGEVRFHKPVVYQIASAQDSSGHGFKRAEQSPLSTHPLGASAPEAKSVPERQYLDGHYVLDEANHRVSFEIAAYDASRPLIIDPVLSYSTFLGGSRFEVSSDIAIDSSGNAYLVGITDSLDFPTITGAFQTSLGGGDDVFVTKLNAAAGSALVYSTYLGGSGFEGFTIGIAVDASGNAYVTGQTGSADFPTLNPIQGALAGFSDVFVTKLNSTGSALLYSTYLGGSSFDEGISIAVDASGNAYVTGQTGSADFPTLNPIQGALAGFSDVFVTKFNAAGSALDYSTYLGGAQFQQGEDIAVDSSGNAYVTGNTGSIDFPTTTGAFQTVFAGGSTDGFVTKLNATGSALDYCTYLGGSSFDE